MTSKGTNTLTCVTEDSNISGASQPTAVSSSILSSRDSFRNETCKYRTPSPTPLSVSSALSGPPSFSSTSSSAAQSSPTEGMIIKERAGKYNDKRVHKRKRQQSLPIPPALQSPDASLPSNTIPLAPAANPIEQRPLDSLQEFFRFKYPTLYRGKGHTENTETRSPGVFDTHLKEEYRLRRVLKLDAITTDLQQVAQKALEDYPVSLPTISGDHFPTTDRVLNWIKASRQDSIQSEADIERIYCRAVGMPCTTVAETLLYGKKLWSPECLNWSFRPLNSNEKGDPVAKNHAVADGFLNIFDPGAGTKRKTLSKDQQDVFDSFPVLAIWEFKNLNFCSGKDGLSTFQGISSLLGGCFPWATCKFEGQCVAQHPQIATTGAFMGWDAEHHPCQSYHQARDSPEYRQHLKEQIFEAQKAETDGIFLAKGNRSRVEKRKAAYVTKRAVRKAALLEKGEGSSRLETVIEESTTFNTEPAKTDLNRDLLKPLSKFVGSSRDLIQQVWAEAVRHDATFICVHAGNLEIICIRDRLMQTLYVSDMINVHECKNYMQLHTGLIIAAVRDAEDRARLLADRPIPKTWFYESGVVAKKALNLRGVKEPKVAQKLLLKEAQTRTWLKFQASDMTYLPFTKDLYHRVEEHSLDTLDIPFTRESSFEPSEAGDGSQDATLHAAALERYTSRESSVSRDLSPTPSQDLLTLSQALNESHQHSLEDHGQETPLDYNTFYQLHVSLAKHGTNRVCRGTLKIHGALFANTFKGTDHPVLVIKNASTYRDIKALKAEYKALCALNNAGVSGVPYAYGFYHSPNKQDPEQSFAALVMEDMGLWSLRNIEVAIDFRIKHSNGKQPSEKRKRAKTKHENYVDITTAEQNENFSRVLNEVHKAGYAHGNLTKENLILRQGIASRSASVAFVGFKHAVPLEYAMQEVIFSNEKQQLQTVLATAAIPSRYRAAAERTTANELDN
ncbi:hypothetical protein H0H87_005972 [Tephrocybe sp. NHM501043]|nr:hypothetical protein H0H87_005972 [Tephrocybe sp. NHM501043]